MIEYRHEKEGKRRVIGREDKYANKYRGKMRMCTEERKDKREGCTKKQQGEGKVCGQECMVTNDKGKR